MDIKKFNLPGDGLGSLGWIPDHLPKFDALNQAMLEAAKAGAAEELRKTMLAVSAAQATQVREALAVSLPTFPELSAALSIRCDDLIVNSPPVPTFAAPVRTRVCDLEVRIDALEDRVEAVEAERDIAKAERDAWAARCSVLENRVRELRTLRRSEVLDASQEHKPDPPVNESPFPDPR